MTKFHSRVRILLICLLSCIMALSVAVGLFVMKKQEALADSATQADNDYFYKQLDSDGKKFYNSIAAMEQDGTLKKNGDYDLINKGGFAATYFNGYSDNATIMQAFGAARDAYALDHPEVFYVDLDYLTLTVGTDKNNSTAAYLGAGRADNYMASESFKNEATLNTAITSFNSAVQTIVDTANTKTSDVEKIRSVNAQILSKVVYTYIDPENSNGTFIHNPYGALVNGKAVCEGYARAFKICMDKLNIPCILVRGYAQSVQNGGYDAHMWNYVKLNNLWYAIDTTWNDGEGIDDEYYFLLGSEDMEIDHEPSGYVSASGKEFTYPALNAYNYGGSMGDFDLGIEYSDDSKALIDITMSYKGKSAQKLLADDKQYLAMRFSMAVDTTGEIQWAAWFYVGAEYYVDTNTTNDSYSVLKNQSTQTQYIQLGVIKSAPSELEYGVYDANLAESEIVATSKAIGNGTYGSYISQAYTYAKATVIGDEKEEKLDPYDLSPDSDYIIYITADEKLKRTSGDLSVTLTRKNGSEITAATASDYKWDDEKQVFSFKLIPSQTYGEFDYMVKINGLVTVNGNLEPKDANIRFWRKGVVCSKVYNDGRLWMSVYGSPTLVAHNDITENNLQIDNGDGTTTPFTSTQRSQLLLVASKPDTAQQKTMEDKLTGTIENGESLTTDAIQKTETYEIDMLLCGCVAKVPEGSYMQVAFGFPEGYGPEDAGVTFKVYHYKKNDAGEITGVEEVDAVVTEYGIIATVPSFSPFAIVAVDSSKITQTSKALYARTVGVGGTVSTTSSTTGIAKVKSGESITYTFTPDAGYTLDRVLINGTATEVTDNALTFAYADLADNTAIEAFFVADSAKARDAANGITTVSYPVLKVDYPTTTITASQITSTSSAKSNSVLIAVIVVLTVLVAGLIVTFVFLALKGKLFNKKATNTKTKKASR